MRKKQTKQDNLYFMDWYFPDDLIHKGYVWVCASSEDEARLKYKECAKRHPDLIFPEDSDMIDGDAELSADMYEDLIGSHPEILAEIDKYGCGPF